MMRRMSQINELKKWPKKILGPKVAVIPRHTSKSSIEAFTFKYAN